MKQKYIFRSRFVRKIKEARAKDQNLANPDEIKLFYDTFLSQLLSLDIGDKLENILAKLSTTELKDILERIEAKISPNQSILSSCSQDSLETYLGSTNQTTLFGLNFEFLINVWRSEIPANSSKWHPQSTAQWFSVQTKMCRVAVLFGLLWRCSDGEIASWVSRKIKIWPILTLKVKFNCR